MPYLTSNGIRMCYDTAGDAKDTPLMLIMGLGMQMTGWLDGLVEELVALGFYVVRFDNRDCGLSDKIDHAGTPNLPLTFLKHLVRWPLKAAYRLDDMAVDAIGVLNALGIRKAHVVGLSMGGMIAQILAARHAERILSLTSVMSTSGRRSLPGPSAAARRALFKRPASMDHDTLVAHGVSILRVIGSPAYPTPERQLRQLISDSIRRSVCPNGMARQMLAIAASGDRCRLLPTVNVPTLVIHGAADPLLPVAAGRDTAALVPGAQLEIIEGMGHDFPPQLIERIAALIDAHAHGKMGADSTAQLFEPQ